MFRSATTFGLVFACLAFASAANAAVLEVSAVDYGTPGNSYNGAPLPGESGNLFLTFRNPSSEVLQDIALNFYKGSCLEAPGGGALKIARLEAGERQRIATPLHVSVQANCARGDAASFLLLGTYFDIAQNPQRVWSEVNLSVAPHPNIDFYQENLNFYLPDRSSVDYTFTISNSITINEVGVFIEVDHRWPSDLIISMVHPSGLEVNLVSRNNSLSYRLGWGGTPHPPLQALAGLGSTGVWTLRFQDVAGGDTGHLRKVGLYLRGQ